MRFERSRKHMIDFIFPLTLLLVFAVSATDRTASVCTYLLPAQTEPGR